MRIVLAALLALVIACSPSDPPRPAPYNILIIVADTLRVDRLGAYGNTRKLTPFLDTLAERGFVFTNAYAPSSGTLPSVASLLTSRFPTQHGVTGFFAALAPEEITLAELLQARGYATAGFSANLTLAGKAALGQGFDTFWTKFFSIVRGRKLPPRATEINAEGLRWVQQGPAEARPRPFFLYLQYMEPHPPYDPPSQFVRHAGRSSRAPNLGSVQAAMGWGIGKITPTLLEDIETVYDAEVMDLDQGVRAIFAALAQQGRLQHTIVVITADHGESLGERGRFGHAWSLYNDLVHVPLIVLVPGQTRRTDIDATVSLLDVAPTLLDLVGAERPARFEGHSFADLLISDPRWTPRGAAAWWRGRTRSAYTELYLDDARTKRLQAIVRGSGKLIVRADGQRELYDLAADPLERVPVSSIWGQSGLEEGLRIVSARLGTPAGSAPAIPIDEETRQRLHALGYAEGTAASAGSN